MAWKIRQSRKGRPERAKRRGDLRAGDRQDSGQSSPGAAHPAFPQLLAGDEGERPPRASAGGMRNRSQRDRRGWKPMPPLPFKDHNGIVVTHDRRRLPERRLDNIVVEWYL